MPLVLSCLTGTLPLFPLYQCCCMSLCLDCCSACVSVSQFYHSCLCLCLKLSCAILAGKHGGEGGREGGHPPRSHPGCSLPLSPTPLTLCPALQCQLPCQQTTSTTDLHIKSFQMFSHKTPVALFGPSIGHAGLLLALTFP